MVASSSVWNICQFLKKIKSLDMKIKNLKVMFLLTKFKKKFKHLNDMFIGYHQTTRRQKGSKSKIGKL